MTDGVDVGDGDGDTEGVGVVPVWLFVWGDDAVLLQATIISEASNMHASVANVFVIFMIKSLLNNNDACLAKKFPGTNAAAGDIERYPFRLL